MPNLPGGAPVKIKTDHTWEEAYIINNEALYKHSFLLNVIY